MFSGILTRQDGGEGGSRDGFTAFPENIGGALKRCPNVTKICPKNNLEDPQNH